ncbi:hypothetical protein H310_10522 [Aphanomyces invadans]|uniref:EGF-like domain-containing protein n=1 Tax=Aphanomyces invadans TaxID=157072 RepID=A0A024TQT8_9STRA|nr:hypothetical protein H310_10522 [Aphanomyces invadans]ETV96364.1 hypothetical protein H310_10522 [Aphanomyces invadans]|eukprot:XP_008875156.1 hypothetical protein H310_10522 [Aphanomyces invadans]
MVKVLAFGALTASFASAALPGQCKTDSNCAQFGQGYTCVSVQSNVAGIALASQCVLGSACGGNTPGKCPTFSSWTSKFQQIQPVCAFAPAENCVPTRPPVLEGEEMAINPVTTANPASVNCYTATFTANNDTVKVQGIYKCLDAEIYTSQNLGGLQNLTDSQMQACQGNATDSFTPPALCNGHGTCSPVGSLSSTYRCVCNQGYSVDDNCLKAVSNVCDSFGSCGQGNTCDPTTGQCICSEGTTGPQCSLCDGSPAACSTNGACSDGVCTCKDGYIGTFCEKIKPATPSPSTTDSGNGTGSAATATVSMAVAAVGLLTWVFESTYTH